MKWFLSLILSVIAMASSATSAHAEFQAGAAIVNVVPDLFPVLVNGGMTSRSTETVVKAVNARALVLKNDSRQLAIVVVDSCMMPQSLLDDAKALATVKTGIAADHVLISATHTHTAPSSMGALGTPADSNYVPFLRQKLVEAIAAAQANLEPAQVGWGSCDANEFTALRRWIRRSDRVDADPFGNPTVQANMHAGRNPDVVTGESGPEDPELAMISFQSLDGRPIAVLGNFSMHYFSGVPALHPDYFGLFCDGLKERIASTDSDEHPPFVGLMSHGCSGDIWRRDYRNPSKYEQVPIEEYTSALLDRAVAAYEEIEYHSPEKLAMAETRIPVKYRVPNEQLLEWSQKIVDGIGDRLPKTQDEIYAREQLFLHEMQETKIVVQALRIGKIAIVTTPTETYALTGLKFKLQSPFESTMVIELANGGDGYIPPPEQHVLGGYNTWAARSAGLEVTAEPKVVAAGLQLLEQVTGEPRKPYAPTIGTASKAISDMKPLAYWHLADMSGPVAVDATQNHHDGFYEPRVAFFLDGPTEPEFTKGDDLNRAAHFAGGRLRTRLPELQGDWSISLWIWNGMPTDARAMTGWILSRGHEFLADSPGIHLGLGGQDNNPGRLILHSGDTDRTEIATGKQEIERWTWNHVVLVCKDGKIRVFLNNADEPEITTESSTKLGTGFETIFFAGHAANEDNWEGRLDEIAVFDRALSDAEIKTLMQSK
ncbi:LamG-like jellyroll fold domain-containing protein [Thalassoroseus pseudoceratinae]|uniref:LamG-like jellyroll fold domain-containing protein n=1 Tax=Thalassoroseus pseudoceratinae TaxID=2713176 RepID=UPI00142248D2|nr:LamG-like jellyroll fold domain-containing protein [Thalassoroseus pseudoceratinae]